MVKQLNDDLSRSLNELELANKELESFSYSVSHDLRAPLRAIRGYTKILQEDYGTNLHEDALKLMNSVTGNAERIGFYYLIFQLVDLAGAIVAFSFEPQNIAKLWMLIPQRFTYRWLMYYILFKALSKAMKGELQGWGVLKRTGNVKMGSN